jgi:diketogulonate reductase-like aldo/keto reductase
MSISVGGVPVPALLYGTAWKEEATAGLVHDALAAGFRGLDTANQRKHYDEAGVGLAVATALRTGTIRRDALFLQTKFTHRDGQDHRLPYDPTAPIADQVAQSCVSSRAHLAVDHLDSLILHGPSQRDGLGPDDHAAWRAMEAQVAAGEVRLLGISNVSVRHVTELVAFSRVPVAFVQNRCYADRGWDRAIREVCAAHGIVYQAFSLLTANRQVLGRADVGAIAARHGKTPAQVVFRFAQQRGMIPLTGTTSAIHMREDLAAAAFDLDAGELAVVDDAR